MGTSKGSFDTWCSGRVLEPLWLEFNTESVCEGVPMLCRPYFGDQGLSAKYVCSVWKVGLELEGVLERGKIERAIRGLMVETEGVETTQSKGFKAQS